jgi:hypothetical protein
MEDVMAQLSEAQAQETWARITARTWEDPAFKQQFLATPKPFLQAAGFEIPETMTIRIVEQGTPEAAAVGVFTLTTDAAGAYTAEILLPKPPSDLGGELSDEVLDHVVGGGTPCCCCCTPCCCSLLA